MLSKRQVERIKVEAAIKSNPDLAFFHYNSIMGYFNYKKNARFAIIAGARQAGKTYWVQNKFIKANLKHKVPYYHIRLKESSTKKLLANGGEKLIDPALRRKYNLHTITKGNDVYRVKLDKNGKVIKGSEVLLCRVLALSTFYADKGVEMFDHEFLDKNQFNSYNILMDEFSPEKSERSSGDICYQFVNQLENILRNTKRRIRCFMLCNAVEECNDIMAGLFNFIPETFGKFWLDSKKAIVLNLEPTDAYLKMRSESVADLLMPTASTFTNQITTDTTLVYKGRLTTPKTIIKFDKDKSKWFVIWDNGIIAQYNGEKVNNIISMRPYIDEMFVVKSRDAVIMQFDTRGFLYKNLITFKKFQQQIQLIKPRGK